MIDLLLSAALAALAAPPPSVPSGAPAAVSTAVPERPPGYALLATKILTAADQGPAVIDGGVLLVSGSTIEAVGRRDQVEIPADYEVIDVGDDWLMPGLVELHSHIGSGQLPFPRDINDTVYLTNPGLSARAAIVPGNALLRRGVAGGVTTSLFIPGSGSNMGGAGVLFKLGEDTYDSMIVRERGSLKLAQAGNPEGWCAPTVGVGRAFMNWNTRNTLLRGRNYARTWKEYQEHGGEPPRKNIQFEIFRDLAERRTQVATHTQIYQVVLETITMVRQELGFDVYIDHGSFDGYKTAELAQKAGVPAILGPREISLQYSGFIDQDGKHIGMAAAYQERGLKEIGFNTDCVDNGRFITPPQEELQLQAAMSLRYGMDNSHLEGLRGLTSIPARTAGLSDRLGSLEAGKDADVVVITGDPADPRCFVSLVFTNGKIVYDTRKERRRW